MSLLSQIKNMKLLSELMSQDLGYIYGERESGPNGAKKQFLSTGRAFLSALGKDLGFKEPKVFINKAGIAASGEITLRGMWEDSGLELELSQDLLWLDGQNRYYGDCLSIWPIRDMKDRSRSLGIRDAVTLETFKKADCGAMIAGILYKKYEEDRHGHRKAA